MLAACDCLVACMLDGSLEIGLQLMIVALACSERELLRFGLNNDGAVAEQYKRIDLAKLLLACAGLPDIDVSKNLVGAERALQACGGEFLGERAAICHRGGRIGFVAVHPIERRFVQGLRQACAKKQDAVIAAGLYDRESIGSIELIERREGGVTVFRTCKRIDDGSYRGFRQVRFPRDIGNGELEASKKAPFFRRELLHILQRL